MGRVDGRVRADAGEAHEYGVIGVLVGRWVAAVLGEYGQHDQGVGRVDGRVRADAESYGYSSTKPDSRKVLTSAKRNGTISVDRAMAFGWFRKSQEKYSELFYHDDEDDTALQAVDRFEPVPSSFSSTSLCPLSICKTLLCTSDEFSWERRTCRPMRWHSRLFGFRRGKYFYHRMFVSEMIEWWVQLTRP